MALRQLMLGKKLQDRNSKLDTLREETQRLEKREAELAESIDEAKTEDEQTTVEEAVEQLEQEVKQNNENKEQLEQEISDIQNELDELETDNGTNDFPHTKNDPEGEERSMNKPKTQSREAVMSIRESMNVKEVRDFYTSVASAIQNKRGLEGTESTIPLVVLDRITNKLGDYSTLVPEVDLQPIHGTGRVILDANIPEAIWTEMTGALKELEDKFNTIDLDGFSLGGFIPVPNSVIEDSMIPLATYVEDRIAKAIAKGLDKAILNGKGASSKELTGIIPSIPEDHKVKSASKLGDIVSHLGLVDADGTGGDVVAVINRKTYYSKILPQTITATSDGKIVAGDVSKPNLAGLRIVLSAQMEDDAVLFGDFKQYLLAQRANIRLESSKDVRFIEDQTVFKGVGRYDGKPLKPKAFALVSFGEAPTPPKP